MSILIIGGAYQGKLAYVNTIYKGEILSGQNIDEEVFMQASCINELHLFVKKLLNDGVAPDDITNFIIANTEAKIIICDDICSGIVPIDETENQWRETTGRLLCDLSKKVDTVIRMQCGIPQTIKGSEISYAKVEKEKKW